MTRCPRDRQILASNDVNGYRYYSCGRCRGYWIPGTSLHRALATKGVQELHVLPRVGKGEMKCPDCYAECDALLIEDCRLDLCVQCSGVWLDSGEVQRVQRLFPSGSAVVDAETMRVSNETLGAFSVVDLVGNLLLPLLG